MKYKFYNDDKTPIGHLETWDGVVTHTSKHLRHLEGVEFQFAVSVIKKKYSRFGDVRYSIAQ